MDRGDSSMKPIQLHSRCRLFGWPPCSGSFNDLLWLHTTRSFGDIRLKAPFNIVAWLIYGRGLCLSWPLCFSQVPCEAEVLVRTLTQEETLVGYGTSLLPIYERCFLLVDGFHNRTGPSFWFAARPGSHTGSPFKQGSVRCRAFIDSTTNVSLGSHSEHSQPQAVGSRSVGRPSGACR